MLENKYFHNSDFPECNFAVHIVLLLTRYCFSFRNLERTIEELSKPAPGVKPLRFEKKYPQNGVVQTVALLWKNNITYWRTPEYNFVRFLFCTVVGVIFGSIYWNLGTKR
jgi:hypothetical protein